MYVNIYVCESHQGERDRFTVVGRDRFVSFSFSSFFFLSSSSFSPSFSFLARPCVRTLYTYVDVRFRSVLFNFLREQHNGLFPFGPCGGSHPSMPRCCAKRRRRSYADFWRATWTIREIFRPHDIFIKLTVHPPPFSFPVFLLLHHHPPLVACFTTPHPL